MKHRYIKTMCLVAFFDIIHASFPTGTTPLMIASTNINPFDMFSLLQTDTTINEQNSEGQTALILSVEFNRPLNTAVLLGHNADKNQENNAGETALEIAIEDDNFVLIQILSAP